MPSLREGDAVTCKWCGYEDDIHRGDCVFFELQKLRAQNADLKARIKAARKVLRGLPGVSERWTPSLVLLALSHRPTKKGKR